ncbi:curli assembly protein CsgF [Cupriavidus numazuensis]|uniref:Curli production assembly/transport component CsgF n=1 Tax=Cupriavidus numazuensis TaxID=221992 RepID=A0ABN7Q1I0_9BURK|nr:curli assembly protein CsgF [Cupriavidus numazuensis]CAG2153010.1 hypothetical protein LMG26411_04321 [Cupriavidus numazuensis]
MNTSRAFRTMICLLGLTTGAAHATELVYVPINPSFGGNPLNGPVLLNSAVAQDKHKDSAPSSPFAQQSALQQFNDTLQRAILSRISSTVSSSIVGSTGQLVPGTVETTDFRIVVTQMSGGVLQVTTTDKTTGQSTQFQVSQ